MWIGGQRAGSGVCQADATRRLIHSDTLSEHGHTRWHTQPSYRIHTLPTNAQESRSEEGRLFFNKPLVHTFHICSSKKKKLSFSPESHEGALHMYKYKYKYMVWRWRQQSVQQIFSIVRLLLKSGAAHSEPQIQVMGYFLVFFTLKSMEKNKFWCYFIHRCWITVV